MRTYTSGGLTINYPDGIIQAFNPHYIEISGVDYDIKIAVGDKAITIQPYESNAKVFISRLIQLCFDKGEYAKELTISIYNMTDGQPTIIMSFATWALWGVRRIDDLCVVGGFPQLNGTAPQIVRKVVKFGSSLPFTFPFFFFDDTESAVATFADGTTETITAEAEGTGIIDFNWNDYGFPEGETITFNQKWARIRYTQNRDIIYSIPAKELSYRTALKYLFRPQAPKDMYEMLKIEQRGEENGYYLRWRDRHGFLRYWLFVKGKTNEKIEMVDYSVEDENIVQGEYYQNQTRIASKNSQDTIECCAVHLDEYEVDIVRDIITSPEIDLYMGKNTGDEDIWQPVNVVSGTYTIEPNCNAKLQNYTIKFMLPLYESQHI